MDPINERRRWRRRYTDQPLTLLALLLALQMFVFEAFALSGDG